MRTKSLPMSVRTSSIPERPLPRRSAPAPRSRLTDVTATLVMVLTLVIGFVATEHAQAGQSAMAVSGDATPGATLMITGTNFGRLETLQVLLDRDANGMPSVTTDRSGNFSVAIVLPSPLAAGDHELAAARMRGNGARVAVAATVVVSMQATSHAGGGHGSMSEPPSPSDPASTPSASPSTVPVADADPVAEPEAVAPPLAATPAPLPAAPAPVAPTPAPAPPMMANPVSCDGYPEPRIWLESQAWWLQTPGAGGTHFGHAHVGTCFPYNVPVAGQVAFDVKITFFDNPGTLVRLAPHVTTASDTYNFDQPELNWTAPNGMGELWQHVVIDTTRIPVDGLQELRMFAQIREPDGKEMHVSTGWQLNIANGRPASNYRAQGLAFTEGRGWYTDVDYTVARFSSVIPPSVSGVWTFNVDLKPGAGGIPVTSHTVAVDANVHMGMPGWVIQSGAGEYVGQVSIDTRQLANGQHKLMLRADAAAATGSTNSGLLVIVFNVAN